MSRDADLSIVGIVSVDEDACIHPKDCNHESLPMRILDERKLSMSLTDVAPPGGASYVITSHCTVSNQHIAHDLVIAAHCTVLHQHIALDLVTAAHCAVSYRHIAPDMTTYSVEPMDIRPLASNIVSNPVHATISSVESTETCPIACDTVSSIASVTLKRR